MAYVWFLPLSAVSAVSVPLSPPLSLSLFLPINLSHLFSSSTLPPLCVLVTLSSHLSLSRKISPYISAWEWRRPACAHNAKRWTQGFHSIFVLIISKLQGSWCFSFWLRTPRSSSSVLTFCSQLCWSKATGLALYLCPPHSCSLPTSTPTPYHPC